MSDLLGQPYRPLRQPLSVPQQQHGQEQQQHQHQQQQQPNQLQPLPWQQQQQQQQPNQLQPPPWQQQRQQQQQQQPPWGAHARPPPPTAWGPPRGGFSNSSSSSNSSHSSSTAYAGARPGAPQAWRSGSPAAGGGGRGGYTGRGAAPRGSGMPRSGSWGGASGGSSSSRGSPRPSEPPCWVKRGHWLVPHPGSREEALLAVALEQQQQQGPASGFYAELADAAAIDARGAPPRLQLWQLECAPRVAVILRGLPGSGKSTRAAQIAAEAEAQQRGADAGAAPAAAIHSTDAFFVGPDGVYRFDAALLGDHHAANHAAFCASLQRGTRCVIVDNTNITPWQFSKYVTAAWAAGYAVREEVVGEATEAAAELYARRNVHGVPHDKILMMLDAWRRAEA